MFFRFIFNQPNTNRIPTGYLKQRMTTSAHLKKLLMQRVKKAAEALATEEGKSRAELEREGEGWVDAVLAGLTESGAMDDTAYATAKARGVQDRGGSTRKVAAKLASKGLSQDQVREVMAVVKEERPDAEREAIVALVRRKKLGPIRAAGERRANFQKDLGMLARAGFAFDLAKSVLSLATEEDLDGFTTER